MDLPTLPIGLALLAIAGAAAGLVAWSRRPSGGGTHARPAQFVPTTAATPATESGTESSRTESRAEIATTAVPAVANAAANAAIPTAGHSAPAPSAVPAFEGPAWEVTEPMRGIAIELPFADTMPADAMPADMDFAATNFAATNFAATNFADTLSTDLVADERLGAALTRPGRLAPAALPAP